MSTIDHKQDIDIENSEKFFFFFHLKLITSL